MIFIFDYMTNLIAAVPAEVDADQSTDVNSVWAEEPYRNRGTGSYLPSAIEHEAKEIRFTNRK